MTPPTQTLSRRLLETVLWTLFLSITPLHLLAHNGEMLWPLVYLDLIQDSQPPKGTAGDLAAADVTHEADNKCWTAWSESDKAVRVIEQTLTAGMLIHRVQPKYPKAARKAHIEGTVVLCAVIGRDGKVAHLRAVSGPEELIESTMKAVQQWVYKPYLLDGVPVEVETDIRVNYRLN